MRENKGKIVPEKEYYDKFIKDDNITVPYIAITGNKDRLAFNRDLLGEDFLIYEHFAPFTIDFHDDQNQRVKIDIDKENGWYRITQGKLSLILRPEDFSLDEVCGWLKRSIRHVAISSDEMGKYLDLVIQDLKKHHSIEELSLNRFRLKERIQQEILAIIQAYAKGKFEDLLKNKQLNVSSVFYTPDEKILMARISPEHFQRHLFERAGNLNGEETELALRLDALENIDWWYRNREKQDFYLQGFKPGKFYPDFIVKTKSGNYILVEYKGEDRLTNEDTEYKVQLGKIWEQLSEGKHKFYLVNENTADEVLKEISTK